METSKWGAAMLLITVVLMQGRIIGAQMPGFTFEARIHDYENPSRRRANGDCCEGSWINLGCLGAMCEPSLRFCLRPPDRPESAAQSCQLGVRYADDDEEHGGNNLQSLLVFRMDQEWPEGFQLRIDITDESGDQDHEVDTIIVQMDTFTPSSEFTTPRSYYGDYENSHIELSFRVSCDSGFYGADCATFCTPANDDTTGHYTCDEDGNRVCLEGYTDPSTNCVTAEDPCAFQQQPCMNGGMCVAENGRLVCECAEGYQGPNCESTVPTTGTTASTATETSTEGITGSPDSKTTPEEGNSTDILVVSGQRSASAGTVAGSLVAVLTVVTALGVLAAVGGFAGWRHRRNRKRIVKECPKKTTHGNPMYAVETDLFRRSNIPVETHHAKGLGHPFGNSQNAPANAANSADGEESLYENQLTVQQAQNENRPMVHKPIKLPPSPAPMQDKPITLQSKDMGPTGVVAIDQPAAHHPPPSNKPPPPPPHSSISPRAKKSAALAHSPRINLYASYDEKTMQMVLAGGQGAATEHKPQSAVDVPDYDEPTLENPPLVFDDSVYAAPSPRQQNPIFDDADYV